MFGGTQSGETGMTSLDQSAQVPAPPWETSAVGLLSAKRLRVIVRCWLVVAPIAYLIDLLRQTQDGLTDGIRRAFGDDFINYWSGAYLAFHGRAAEVYDIQAFHVFEQSILGLHIHYYTYSYPPVLLVLSLPLALMPYVPGLGVWLIATWYGFYRALKLTGREGVLLLSVATPALFVSAVGGQNGAMTAALLGGGLTLLDRRPVVAGVLLGLLAYKPHLGLMLPFAVIAGRRWLAMGAAAATVLLLVTASVVLFGADRWADFANTLTMMRTMILEDGTGIWHRMPSVFVFVRRLGAGPDLAYALQAAAALTAAFFVARSWFRDDPAYLRNAMVVVGTCLATPYLQDYDLVMGAFVVVWLRMGEGRSRIRASWMQAAMAMILLAPFMCGALGKATGLAFGPLFIVPVFALLLRMAAEHRAEVYLLRAAS
jgi:Glycosyltransferase family 87